MIDREMLSAISDLLDEKLEQKLEEKLEEKLEKKFDEKLQPIYDRLDGLESRMDSLEGEVQYIKVVQLENNVIPRLSTIESCYLDTAQRYIKSTEQIDEVAADVSVLKTVASNHSERLQNLERHNKELQSVPG